MEAVLYRGVGEVALETVPEPNLQQSTHTIVRTRSSAIYGPDSRFNRGTFPGVVKKDAFSPQAIEPSRTSKNLFATLKNRSSPKCLNF